MRKYSLVVFVALLFLGPNNNLEAATIVLKNGKRITGKILSRDSKVIRVESEKGTQTLELAEIKEIIEDDSDTPEDGAAKEDAPEEIEKISGDQFRDAYEKIRRDDADAYVELGKNAEDAELVSSARQAFRAAIRAYPDHEEARSKLGYVRFAGEWTTADRMLRERGLVQRNGRWMPVDSTEETPELVVKPVAKPVAKKDEAKPKNDDPNAWYDDHTTIAEWDKAAFVKSKNYIIRSNIKTEYVKRYGKMMDRYYDRFKSVFKSFMPSGAKIPRCVITIYPEQKKFMENEKKPANVGGFYRLDTRVVVTYHGRFGKNGTTRTVLVHEGTHQFQHIVLGDNFRNCPVWLIEGLAVLFEAAEWNPKANKVNLGKIPHDRLETMKRAVKAKNVIPLKDLFNVPQQRFTGFHYAHAWAMIYQLIYGSKSKKQRKTNAKIISDLFAMGKKRKVRTRDVVKVFGGAAGLAKYEEEWKKWIEKVPYDFKP
jgi:hypothetical protein